MLDAGAACQPDGASLDYPLAIACCPIGFECNQAGNSQVNALPIVSTYLPHIRLVITPTGVTAKSACTASTDAPRRFVPLALQQCVSIMISFT